MNYSEIQVGTKAEFEVELTLDMVDAFGALSGDTNPLHMDQAYAEQTEFKGRVAHGMFAGIWFSRLIGMYLPGESALYLSQEIRFHKPLLPGKKFIVRGEVLQKTDAVQVITLMLCVIEQPTNVVCAEGSALVRVR